MDPGKIVEAIEKFGRDGVFFVLGVLLPARGAEGGERVYSATNSRTYVFAFICVFFGGAAYLAAKAGSFSGVTGSVAGALFSLAMWLAFSGLAHLFMRVIGGKATYLETLGACLRVLPVAYLVAGFVALVLTKVGVAKEVESRAFAFLIAQFLVIAVYLPWQLVRVHKVEIIARVAATIMLPAAILAINFLSVGGSSTDPFPASEVPAMSPVPTAKTPKAGPAGQKVIGPSGYVYIGIMPSPFLYERWPEQIGVGEVIHLEEQVWLRKEPSASAEIVRKLGADSCVKVLSEQMAFPPNRGDADRWLLVAESACPEGSAVEEQVPGSAP